MDGGQLEKTQSFQYPQSHFGHLNSTQQSALESFRSLCEQEGYYKPAGPEGKPAASHDDETLLRYLRARKFVPNDAYGQFKETEDWRKENQLEKLYDTIDINEFEATRRLYTQWTGRVDRRGIPVYVFEVACLNAKTMAEYEKSFAKAPAEGPTKSSSTGQVSTKMARLFALYENLTRFVLPLCSAITDRPYPETPVSQSNNIVDISRVGLKQFWNLKGHMQNASQLATAYYPETLDRIFIIGAPSFFPTVWNWIKRWFDPITVSKIFILGPNEVKKTLEQYIDPADIPKRFGGKLDWDFGDRPVLSPALQNVLDWKIKVEQKGENTFPIGPVKWVEGSDGTTIATAVGSENGSRRDLAIATMKILPKPSGLAIPKRDPMATGPLSTTGTHTHPDQNGGYFPHSGETPVESETVSRSSTPPKQDQDEATALPLRTGSSPTDFKRPARTGTSNSRLEQQDQTLAAGQMAEGTPDTVTSPNNDKTAIVEPSTVGQARKDVTIQPAEPAEEAKAPTYFEQAKGAAGSVFASVTNAVGLGSAPAPEEEKSKAPEQVEDARVDNMDKSQVEAYMRDKLASSSADSGDKDVKAT